jgi:alanine racemase
MPIYIYANMIKNNFLKITKMYNKVPGVVLKSNAYSLELKNIIPILLKTECAEIFVNNIQEAIEIRSLTDKFTIFLLENNEIPNLQTLKDYNIIPIINSLENLQQLANANINICLQLDIAMNRTGLKMEEIQSSLEIFQNMSSKIIKIIGHLSITSTSPKDFINEYHKKNFDFMVNLLLNNLNLGNMRCPNCNLKGNFDMEHFKILLNYLLELNKKIKCPYYMGVNKLEKRSFPYIRFYDSKIAMMISLYGNVNEYLDSIKVKT